ncbi:MAG: uroporphyrinogen decarboxylase family protein [Anaerolineae bacterium]
MGLYEDRIKALTFDHPDAIPVGVSILPAAWMKHRDALQEIVDRHPIIFGDQTRDKRDYDAVSGTYVEGTHVDAWGCVWENVAHGMEAIVTKHPVPTRADVHKLKPPVEDAGLPHGFMYLRLADLRGFEEIMMDFAEEPPELQMLIDIVLEYNLRQVALRLETLTDEDRIVYFGDDLGMQTSLPMSPRKWRKYLKPCFAAIYKPVCESGRYVYMHTDGHILEIIPDLIDCCVSVVNPQVGANGLDALAEVAKGRVCLDLDLDRQMFPFCTPEDIDAHVREAVETLGAPEGGLWLKAEIGPDVPLENVEAICQALERYRGYFS